MRNKLKVLSDRALDSVSTAASNIRDINFKSVGNNESIRATTDWAKDTIEVVGRKSTEIVGEAMSSSIAKDAASFAAVGAVLAMPLPIIGPLTGAAIGACAGIYKNIKNPSEKRAPTSTPDIYEELMKLEELRNKDIITQAEFDDQKRKILKTR